MDNVEGLDIVMLMYNLLEYIDNYCMTAGTLWNYYRDEVNMMLMKIKMLVIIWWITTRQQEVNLLSLRQK